MKRKPDPLLRLMPWKIAAVFGPIERILHRIEADGTVDAAGRQIVFREDGRGGWYDAVAALRGVIEFHEIATSRHGLPADVSGLTRLANKLDTATPIFLSDIESARASIDSCKRQAMSLRLSQSTDIVRTLQISMQLQRLGKAA